jgi:hypothetical protein
MRRGSCARSLGTTVTALVAIFMGSACTGARNDGAGARESELAIRTLMASWESADSAVIRDLFWPQATYDDFPNQATHQGVEEIVGYVTSPHAWGDDVFMSVGEVHASESGAVAEWVFSAVQNRPMGTTVPVATGLEVVMNGVTIIELDRGRILRAADYADPTPLWLQLGGRIELPGGGVIELQRPGN